MLCFIHDDVRTMPLGLGSACSARAPQMHGPAGKGKHVTITFERVWWAVFAPPPRLTLCVSSHPGTLPEVSRGRRHPSELTSGT